MSLGNVTYSEKQLETILESVMFQTPTKKEAYQWNGNTYPTLDAALLAELKSKLKTDCQLSDSAADQVVSHRDAIHSLFHEYETCKTNDNDPSPVDNEYTYKTSATVGQEANNWGW